MVPPRATELIDHRLTGMGIGRDQLDAEVGNHECMREQSERNDTEKRLRYGRPIRKGHGLAIILMRALQPQPSLQHADQKRQDQGNLSNLCEHETSLTKRRAPTVRLLSVYMSNSEAQTNASSGRRVKGIKIPIPMGWAVSRSQSRYEALVGLR